MGFRPNSAGPTLNLGEWADDSDLVAAVSALPICSSCFISTNLRLPRRDCRIGGSAR